MLMASIAFFYLPAQAQNQRPQLERFTGNVIESQGKLRSCLTKTGVFKEHVCDEDTSLIKCLILTVSSSSYKYAGVATAELPPLLKKNELEREIRASIKGQTCKEVPTLEYYTAGDEQERKFGNFCINEYRDLKRDVIRLNEVALGYSCPETLTPELVSEAVTN